MTIINALYSMTAYFFLGWTPKLVTDLGFSATAAATVAVTRDMTGIFGGLLLGAAAHYLGLKRLVVMVMIGFAAMLILFGRVVGRSGSGPDPGPHPAGYAGRSVQAHG